MRSHLLFKSAMPVRVQGMAFWVCLVLGTCFISAVAGCGESGSSAADPAAATLAITSVAPATVPAGSAPFTLQISGSGFVPQSVALWNGTSLTTAYVSSTKLTAAVPASLAVSTGVFTITVANPGGGTSSGTAPVVVTLGAPPPVITSVTPASIIVGSPDTPITIHGTGFSPDATILVDIYKIAVSSASPTSLSGTIPASFLGFAAPLRITVQNQDDQSSQFSLPILNPVPQILSLSRTTVTAGGPAFVLNIAATGLVGNTEVDVNGAAVTSSSVSQGNLSVQISAEDIAQIGKITVSLTNPGPGGGTSALATINVIAGTSLLRTVPLPANMLVWNPQQQVIYATVPASASSNASSIVAIDPITGKIIASHQMPSEPNLLAISGDQQFLYVTMNATSTVARMKLPSLAPDIQWTVGDSSVPDNYVRISDIEVAPQLPHTLAVAQLTSGYQARDLAIYDDGILRPNLGTGGGSPYDFSVDRVQWGADASTIYATTTISSGGPELIYSVNAQGATLTRTNLGAVNSFYFDPVESRLYVYTGAVVDPPTGRLLGEYAAGQGSPVEPAGFAVDSAAHRVYFLSQVPYADFPTYAASDAQIQVFDQDTFLNLGTLIIPDEQQTDLILGDGASLIRWGASGLAFPSGDSIYLVDGPFVTPGSPPASSLGSYLSPVPQLTALSPEFVTAGSADTTITVTGKDFSEGASLTWNGNILPVTFISSTEVQATIPAAALTAPTAAPLFVSNSPGEGIATPIAFTVLPVLGNGAQIAALNVSGSDLVWDATAGTLYVAANGTDTLHPRTITTIDPATGTIKASLPTLGNPYVLAISNADQYLYAGFEDSAFIQRYALPGLTPDLLIPLGIGDNAPGDYVAGSLGSCSFAVSLGVAPGTGTTIAATEGNGDGTEPTGCGPTVVIDGATPRPTNTGSFLSTGHDLSALTWGGDATAVYTQGMQGITFQPISSLTVSSTGIAFNRRSTADNYLGYRPHFDTGTGLIYSDGGAVTRPSDLSQVGNFDASGLMVPDSKLGRAYFLGQTPSQIENENDTQNSAAFTLQIYNLKTRALLDSIVIPNVIGYPNQMVRWGNSGIAFTTENGDYLGNNAPGLTYILSAPEISGPIPAQQQSLEGAAPVRLTWQPRKRGERTGGQVNDRNTLSSELGTVRNSYIRNSYIGWSKGAIIDFCE
jgi:hypothetical protein